MGMTTERILQAILAVVGLMNIVGSLSAGSFPRSPAVGRRTRLFKATGVPTLKSIDIAGNLCGEVYGLQETEFP